MWRASVREWHQADQPEVGSKCRNHVRQDMEAGGRGGITWLMTWVFIVLSDIMRPV